MGSGRLGNATSRLGRCDDSVVGALPKNSSPNFKGQRSRKHPVGSVRCQDMYIVVLSRAGQDYEIVVRDLTAERVFPVWRYPKTSGNSTTDRKIAVSFVVVAQDPALVQKRCLSRTSTPITGVLVRKKASYHNEKHLACSTYRRDTTEHFQTPGGPGNPATNQPVTVQRQRSLEFS